MGKELLTRYRGTILYLKADLQGMDVACALDLEASIAPPFASFELPQPLLNRSNLAATRNMLRHLSMVGYVGFKVCRQRMYSARCWGTRCHLSLGAKTRPDADYHP